jgi:hypothetical protein
MDGEINNEQPQPLSLSEEEGRQTLMQKIANATGENRWKEAEELRKQVLDAFEQGIIDKKTALNTLFPHEKPSKKE